MSKFIAKYHGNLLSRRRVTGVRRVKLTRIVGNDKDTNTDTKRER